MKSRVEKKPVAPVQAPSQAQPKAAAAKKPSISAIIHHYWEEHMRRQGLDPNNPPPRDPNKKELSFVGQPCGHSYIADQVQIRLQKKDDATEVPAPKPCGQPLDEKRKLDDAKEPDAKKVANS